MFYGFSVRAATREELSDLIEAEFDKIVALQPIHDADREAAQNAAEGFVSALPDTEGMEFSVSVSGSVSWSGSYPEDYSVMCAGINISASLVVAPMSIATPESGGGGHGDPDDPKNTSGGS